jgi:hypothetical protein
MGENSQRLCLRKLVSVLLWTVFLLQGSLPKELSQTSSKGFILRTLSSGIKSTERKAKTRNIKKKIKDSIEKTTDKIRDSDHALQKKLSREYLLSRLLKKDSYGDLQNFGNYSKQIRTELRTQRLKETELLIHTLKLNTLHVKSRKPFFKDRYRKIKKFKPLDAQQLQA